jgi:hypothetical protein
MDRELETTQEALSRRASLGTLLPGVSFEPMNAQWPDRLRDRPVLADGSRARRIGTAGTARKRSPCVMNLGFIPMVLAFATLIISDRTKALR